MLDKFMKNLFVGMTVLTLFAAGPGALTLALTVDPQTRAEVQRVVNQAPSFQRPLLWQVQDTDVDVGVEGDAPVPPAADDPVDVVPPTEGQEVVIEYGNWVQTLLKPIRDVGLALIPFIGLWIISLLPGLVQMVLPTNRVTELLENAWLSAFNSVNTSLTGRNAKVTVVNSLLRQMTIYAISQAPAISKKIADNLPELLQKLVARIPPELVPSTWTIDDAIKAVTPESVKAAAAKQGVQKKVDRVLKDDGSFGKAILSGFGSLR